MVENEEKNKTNPGKKKWIDCNNYKKEGTNKKV